MNKVLEPGMVVEFSEDGFGPDPEESDGAFLVGGFEAVEGGLEVAEPGLDHGNPKRGHVGLSLRIGKLDPDLACA